LNGAATGLFLKRKKEDPSPAFKLIANGNDMLKVLKREAICFVDAYANDFCSDSARFGAPQVG